MRPLGKSIPPLAPLRATSNSLTIRHDSWPERKLTPASRTTDNVGQSRGQLLWRDDGDARSGSRQIDVLRNGTPWRLSSGTFGNAYRANVGHRVLLGGLVVCNMLI
jgi:hypothetical protein